MLMKETGAEANIFFKSHSEWKKKLKDPRILVVNALWNPVLSHVKHCFILNGCWLQEKGFGESSLIWNKNRKKHISPEAFSPELVLCLCFRNKKKLATKVFSFHVLWIGGCTSKTYKWFYYLKKCFVLMGCAMLCSC